MSAKSIPLYMSNMTSMKINTCQKGVTIETPHHIGTQPPNYEMFFEENLLNLKV